MKRADVVQLAAKDQQEATEHMEIDFGGEQGAIQTYHEILLLEQ